MNFFTKKCFPILIVFLLLSFKSLQAQVIITQYYEGTGTNKWIELTNLGTEMVNTASPQLRLGLWAASGSAGNISISGAPSQFMDLTVIIPAKGSVLIGNPANSTEVTYLTSASAAQTNSQVINFNGNDGVALMDASNNIIDAFGTGINATDRSYYRNLSVALASASFNISEWTLASLAAVQAAPMGNPERLNYHLANNCSAPTAAATTPVFYSVTSNSLGGAFTASVADESLVLLSTSGTLSALPQNGEVYNNGDMIGNATVINRSGNAVFYANNLQPSTNYYFFVFSLNSNCTGGAAYLSSQYLSFSSSTTAIPTAAPFNFYFGNLHAHTGYSDGNMDDPAKTPADAYAFAKNSMCMDFLGISEHNHTGAGMNISRWQPGLAQAAAASTPSFLALYGMEFGVISDGGHAVVYGMDSLVGWEANQYQRFVARGNFNGTGGLFETINNHGSNSFVYLAHPEATDFNNIFSDPYSGQADAAVVGVALETGPANSTGIGYNNPGSSMAFLDYYKILLSKGYHVGPTIDHDNHNMTFGRTARTRLAIISPDLTHASLLQAMRNMNFYATQDCNAKISFNIAGQQMGSVMLRSGAPQIAISCQTASPVATLRIMQGTPGSGSFPVQLASFTTGTVNFSDVTLSNFAERYYYLEITEADGSRIITAPIWYTRVDGTVASQGFTSFTAINQSTAVVLKWSTNGEEPGAVFDIERSANGGQSFQKIGTIAGMGNSSAANNYSFTDDQPSDAIVYYRIRLKDIDGHIQLSPRRFVNRALVSTTTFIVSPNPAKDIAYVHIYTPDAGIAKLELYSMEGKKLLLKPVIVSKGEQTLQVDLRNISRGIYVLKLQLNEERLTRTIYIN